MQQSAVSAPPSVVFCSQKSAPVLEWRPLPHVIHSHFYCQSKRVSGRCRAVPCSPTTQFGLLSPVCIHSPFSAAGPLGEISLSCTPSNQYFWQTALLKHQLRHILLAGRGCKFAWQQISDIKCSTRKCCERRGTTTTTSGGRKRGKRAGERLK